MQWTGQDLQILILGITALITIQGFLFAWVTGNRIADKLYGAKNDRRENEA